MTKSKQIVPQITYKSVLSRIKSIKNRNKAFNALDDESQRLEIAWDALQLCLNKKIKPTDWDSRSGRYWGKGLVGILRKKRLSAEEFQEELLNVESCACCERGLIMLSTVRMGNCLTNKTVDVQMGHKQIVKGFSMYDMNHMEDEYENSYYDHPYEDNTLEKMCNILCNVLVNGNFNIRDKKDYLDTDHDYLLYNKSTNKFIKLDKNAPYTSNIVPNRENRERSSKTLSVGEPCYPTG